MTRPGTGKVLPNMLHESCTIDPDTAAAALAMLDHWGAMDVAPMLGLVEEPPRGPCGCGKCWRCNDRARRAKPWTCPTCGRVLNQGGAGQHLRKVHGVQRA